MLVRKLLSIWALIAMFGCSHYSTPTYIVPTPMDQGDYSGPADGGPPLVSGDGYPVQTTLPSQSEQYLEEPPIDDDYSDIPPPELGGSTMYVEDYGDLPVTHVDGATIVWIDSGWVPTYYFGSFWGWRPYRYYGGAPWVWWGRAGFHYAGYYPGRGWCPSQHDGHVGKHWHNGGWHNDGNVPPRNSWGGRPVVRPPIADGGPGHPPRDFSRIPLDMSARGRDAQQLRRASGVPLVINRGSNFGVTTRRGDAPFLDGTGRTRSGSTYGGNRSDTVRVPVGGSAGYSRGRGVYGRGAGSPSNVGGRATRGATDGMPRAGSGGGRTGFRGAR